MYKIKESLSQPGHWIVCSEDGTSFMFGGLLFAGICPSWLNGGQSPDVQLLQYHEEEEQAFPEIHRFWEQFKNGSS